jgi:hypothetical protein
VRNQQVKRDDCDRGFGRWQILLARARFWFRISAMGKEGICIMAAVLSLGLSLSAQPTNRVEKLLLNDSLPRFSSLALSNAQYVFLSTGLNWLQPTPADFFPRLPAAPETKTVAREDSAKDSSKETVDLSRKNLVDYVHGEVGFLYGRSTGKFDREVEQGYVIGTAGNDRFQITAGASFENWSGRVPRR